MAQKTALWTPSEERIRHARITAFAAKASARTQRDLTAYQDLHQWSISKPAEFWGLLWEEANPIASASYTDVLINPIMPGAQWFVGARLNYAENLLRRTDQGIAIIACSESQQVRRLTFESLRDEVRRCAAGLRRLGVLPGDRVAGFLPNIPETVIAMLATISLGAIWSSCSPDFGVAGVVDRFGQIAPKVLIAADGYRYQGKDFHLLGKIHEIVSGLSSHPSVVIVPYASDLEDNSESRLPSNWMEWSGLTSPTPEPLTFEQLPFHHPIFILYSSGTTGKPKCIVHSAGGTLLQHWKEHALHTDLSEKDTLFYFTTCGWMMWNWLVSALQLGTTILLYEGSPASPDAATLWSMAENERVTVFGTSPKYLSFCEQVGLSPRSSHRLGNLKTILSTGAPLTAGNFSYVYREIKEDVCLSSISGGTDIISCFMLGNPTLPVFSEEIQCRGLGMRVEAFDDSAHPVIDAVGELVCSAPFPSMPIGFWKDPGDIKYKDAYFNHFKGIWRHGDFVKITEQGGVIVYGRSDATLNPAGVRIGTSEIYNPVESMPEVVESLVVGQPWLGDTRIILFVVLANGVTLHDELRERIRATIRSHATPRHLPARIIQVREIPRTLNGKKVELAVTRLIQGKPIDNKDALANPSSLEEYASIDLTF